MACLIGPAAADAAPQAASPGTIGPNPATAQEVARTVSAMVGYTTWSSRPNPMVACLAGNTPNGAKLDGQRLMDGRTITIRSVALGPPPPAGCHILYIASASLARQRQAAVAAQGKQVMTVVEGDLACHSQAMFCLIVGGVRGVTFRMNIDAVARSGLRVDPRVLRISVGGA